MAKLPLLLSLLLSAASPLTILYIPLDERFTTRFAFLNLASVTPFTILTPPMDLISSQKTPAPLPALYDWISTALPSADIAIISLELYLYGGLIPSRCSNDSSATVMSRLQALAASAAQYPNLTLYLSSVVMRIPSYNEDVEEPWYWAVYGADLYTFSYYSDAYDVTGNATDLKLAQAAQAAVPAAIVDEFLWRRARNFNVTSALLSMLAQGGPTPFARNLYITQDDNAQFGFNIAEARALKADVTRYNLSGNVKVYPGADEVGLTMLSRATVDAVAALHAFESGGSSVTPPQVQLVYRDASNASLYRVPNYEGQPMIDTLMEQLAAAGGVVVPADAGSSPREALGVRPAVTLLVNDFSEVVQLEATQQPMTGRSTADYSMFTPFICGTDDVLGFLDNRYSNGADIVFIQYLMTLAADPACATVNSSNAGVGLSMDRFAYAGWNTNGNTLGDSISNALVLHFFATYGPYSGIAAERFDAMSRARRGGAAAVTAADPGSNCTSSCANTYRQVLRVVEDNFWQALLRQDLSSYVNQVNGENDYTLFMDLDFYERYSLKVLGSRGSDISAAFGLPWNITTLYYPWNRTFEIGMFANATAAGWR